GGFAEERRASAGERLRPDDLAVRRADPRRIELHGPEPDVAVRPTRAHRRPMGRDSDGSAVADVEEERAVGHGLERRTIVVEHETVDHPTLRRNLRLELAGYVDPSPAEVLHVLL